MLRTHTCGELTKKEIGQMVTLAGWVHSRRDHGGIIFIDLRDRYGLTQIKFDPKFGDVAYKEADKLRSEWVIGVVGKVVARPADMINQKLITGEVEVEISELKILNKSKTPPFELNEEKADEANENIRLKYRFVDLRRPKIQEMLRTKAELINHIRNYFRDRNFIEVQTPILANSSPEGARDFLIPSRLYPGSFYALPQAPQQFKQLLMVGGLDRYFQIAPCFRDEDSRMDRHYGEFYQLDMEMSFVEQEDVFAIMEPLMLELTEKFSQKKVVNLEKSGRFKQISWRESMDKYGVDKPDLRFDLEIKPITELVRDCGFAVFAEAIKKGGVVHALKIEGGAKFTRKEIDELTEAAKAKEAKGLAYIVYRESGEMQSPITKFLGDDLAEKILSEVSANPGDIVFFGADKWEVVCASLGAVRNECAVKLNLKDNNKASWCWIVDFPMYALSEIEPGRVDFGHNPFSMPQGGLEALKTKKPFEILAHQYDLVLNGFEVSSGAIRNHDPEIMYQAFAIAGYSKEEVDTKFGAMIQAFEYGAPPHGGNAPGIDRILMILNDWDSIRDIYAFPKDGRGRDLMMDSPSEVNEKQLKELGIKLDNKVKNNIVNDDAIYQKLKQFLEKKGIKFETFHHQPVFTSKQAAKIRGTELKQGARALIFKADNHYIQVVTPADRKASPKKLKENYNFEALTLADQGEVKKATDCEVGAVPPFGNLFDLPVYVDEALSKNEFIAFNAGTNTDSIKMKYKDFIKVVQPIIGDFSEEEK